MERIRISGKNLGALALPSFCPRCFWISMHAEGLPYQIFPGIFSSIDSFTKKVTNIHYESHSTIPKWLQSFGELNKPVKSPSHASFFIIDSDTNIHLTGAADEIIQRNDGSYFIVDYKTAKFTGNQDRLLPIYEVQLNAYAYISNKTAFNPVSGIGLVYFEPKTDLTVQTLDNVLMDDGFKLPFSAKLLPLKLQPDKIIPPLLKKVREIVDLNSPPDRTFGCDDCEKLDMLIRLVKS